MNIILSVLLLIVGFVLLIKGADFFVDAASAIAKRLRIPSMVIGLTVVSIGTSLPEAAVSISGALAGANEIAVSNVIGSNFFNLLVVASVAAIFAPMRIEHSTLRMDFPVVLIATALMLFFSADFLFGGVNCIGRIEGIILLLLLIVYIALQIRTTKIYREGLQEEAYQGKPMGKTLLLGAIGLAAIVLGGKITVNAAEDIALFFGLSETVIGLTVVALGTSLPELITSIVASTKGEQDIAIGNVLGSNIFNILFVLGLSSALSPIPVGMVAVIDGALLLGVTLIGYFLCATNRRLGRLEGALLLAMYVVYTVYIFIRN